MWEGDCFSIVCCWILLYIFLHSANIITYFSLFICGSQPTKAPKKENEESLKITLQITLKNVWREVTVHTPYLVGHNFPSSSSHINICWLYKEKTFELSTKLHKKAQIFAKCKLIIIILLYTLPTFAYNNHFIFHNIGHFWQ